MVFTCCIGNSSRVKWKNKFEQRKKSPQERVYIEESCYNEVPKISPLSKEQKDFSNKMIQSWINKRKTMGV